MTEPTAHDRIERSLDHNFRLPERVAELLDAYRDQVLTEAAAHLDRIADATEAKVAEHYGPASGIGPGSADMVREAARSVRSLAAAQPAP